MKNWIIIVLVALLGLYACSANKDQELTKVEKAEVTTQVAILPLKALDSASRYITKILTVRDLELTFDKYATFTLLDMDQIEDQYEEQGFTDVEDMELEEMQDVSSSLISDVIVLGTVSENRSGTYNIAMRFFSPRSGELKQVSFNVGKEKTARWKALDDNLMKELDSFVSNEIDKIFNIATNYYNNMNYVEAEKSLLQVVALKPEKEDAYFFLGQTYLKTEKYDLAEQNFLRAHELDAADQRNTGALIDLYEKTNQTGKRIVMLEELATENNDEEIWLAVGNLYEQQGDMPNAKAAFRKALVANPDYQTANIRLAFILFDEKSYADAIPMLEKAFDRAPDNELISRRLATAYQQSGRMQDAIAKYEGLIRTSPNSTSAYLNLIGLYRNIAQDSSDPKVVADMNKKALDTINGLKAIAPENEYVYLNLASLYLSQSKFNDAETNANATISRNPTLYQAYLILAVVNQTRGTDAYNSYLDLDRQAAKAVGKKATDLRNQRDAAKANANSLFRKAEGFLRTALNYASENEIRTDINNRLANVARLISQSQ